MTHSDIWAGITSLFALLVLPIGGWTTKRVIDHESRLQLVERSMEELTSRNAKIDEIHREVVKR